MSYSCKHNPYCRQIGRDKLIAELKTEPRVRHTEDQIIALIMRQPTNTESREVERLKDEIKSLNDKLDLYCDNAFGWQERCLSAEKELEAFKVRDLVNSKLSSSHTPPVAEGKVESVFSDWVDEMDKLKPLTIEEAKDEVARKCRYCDEYEPKHHPLCPAR